MMYCWSPVRGVKNRMMRPSSWNVALAQPFVAKCFTKVRWMLPAPSCALFCSLMEDCAILPWVVCVVCKNMAGASFSWLCVFVKMNVSCDSALWQSFGMVSYLQGKLDELNLNGYNFCKEILIYDIVGKKILFIDFPLGFFFFFFMNEMVLYNFILHESSSVENGNLKDCSLHRSLHSGSKNSGFSEISSSDWCSHGYQCFWWQNTINSCMWLIQKSCH